MWAKDSTSLTRAAPARKEAVLNGVGEGDCAESASFLARNILHETNNT